MKKTSMFLTAFLFLSLIFSATLMAEAPDATIYLRGNQMSFNSRYAVKIENREILIKESLPQDESVGWTILDLPEGLAGDVTELAMDDEHIIALNSARQIYTMWNGLDEISDFTWQVEWGIPFWKGPGMKLKEDITAWDFSVVSRREDGYWTDPAGHLFEVGAGKCSHIWVLGANGQDLIYIDPWLPIDYSYGICGPERGAFQAVNMSTSGSFLFLINKYGDMYTRFYDFDIGGADFIFPSSWEDQSDKLIPAIQIPSAWIKHPKISGDITDRISIHKIGRNCVNRTMRVEGRDEAGNTGYYEKDVTEVENGSQWVFHKTGLTLLRNPIDNRDIDCTALTLGERDDRYYAKNMANLASLSTGLPWYRIINKNDWAAELTNFSAYNTPVDLVVHLSPSESITLKLHTKETLRVSPRPWGLSDDAKYIPGSIEVPQDLLDNFSDLPVKSQKFIRSYLMKRRHTRVDIQATLDKVTVSGTAGGLLIVWDFHHQEL